jgi:diguanylate cyclase (GGDEF)-like protein
MHARFELVAAAALACLALLAEGAGLAFGHDPGDWFLAAALLACGLIAAFGAARATRTLADERHREALDPLTQLPGGRRLRQDLAAFLEHRLDGERRTLLVFDLAGFKRYNEFFGYAAGDALLRRLAGKLVAAVGDRAQAYRLRGGGFAVLVAGTNAPALRARAAAALCEEGEGFAIHSGHASVVLPDAAREASEALKLADQRIQAQRARIRSRGLEELVLPTPERRAAQMAVSSYDVAAMAVAVGTCLGMTGPELDHLERAAALRDVGMMALPDSLVHEPGPLTAADWRFVHLHPIVGERLLRANFGMEGVAALVRSSHERWDGRGYPDGLGGEEIPLGSRIAFVCSAFQDMTSQRAHRPALTPELALRELQRGAGSQFDPAVVSAFVVTYGDRPAVPEADRGQPAGV